MGWGGGRDGNNTGLGVTVWTEPWSQLLGGAVVKNPPGNAGDARDRLNPWVWKISWRRKWQPTPVFLPGEFYGQRSLADCSPWGHKELDTTEQLSTHVHTHIQPLRLAP